MTDEELEIETKETSRQVKTYAFFIWMIIPATLFLPWLEVKPSDSGGSAIGLNKE